LAKYRREQQKVEIGLCATYASRPIRIVGPFDTTEEAMEAIRHAPYVQGYQWFHCYSGEMSLRSNSVPIEAPVTKTITIKMVPEKIIPDVLDAGSPS